VYGDICTTAGRLTRKRLPNHKLDNDGCQHIECAYRAVGNSHVAWANANSALGIREGQIGFQKLIDIFLFVFIEISRSPLIDYGKEKGAERAARCV
jgi:hypothetical protein